MELPGNAADQCWPCISVISALHPIPLLWVKLFNHFPTRSLFWPRVVIIFLFQIPLQLGKSSLLVLALDFFLFDFISSAPRGQFPAPPLYSSHSVLPTSLLSTTFILSTSPLPTTSFEMMAPEFFCFHQNWMAFSLC